MEDPKVIIPLSEYNMLNSKSDAMNKGSMWFCDGNFRGYYVYGIQEDLEKEINYLRSQIEKLTNELSTAIAEKNNTIDNFEKHGQSWIKRLFTKRRK